MTADAYHGARSAAAIMLKNNVKATYKSMPEEVKSYIRSTILQGLQDNNAQIRNYSGNVITEIVKQGGIMGWPQVLSELIALVGNRSGSVSPETQDGAMGALFKICEDNKRVLNTPTNGQRPLDVLVPEILNFTASPNSKVRAKALGALNIFIDEPLPAAIESNAEKLLYQLIQIAGDQNEDVRRFVCRTFTTLTTTLPAVVLPHMGDVIDYILAQQKQFENPELALDAAEFFFENGDKEVLGDAFAQHLNKIVPVLLEGMIYSEDDQARLEQEAEDAEEEDREQDIKPQFATGRNNEPLKAPEALNGSASHAVNGYAYDDDDLSDGEIDEYGDDYGEDPEDTWNLRKCSAASLDTFSTKYNSKVFEFTLPYLMENLNHADWPNREAAVLALGAIAQGCREDVEPHLPDLVRFLIMLSNDPQPVVRTITCWALGRYSSWAANLDAAGKQQYFEPMMDSLLQRMLDGNKRVQEAAASAFANLEEAAQSGLTPYSMVIAQQFVQCFEKYKDRNMFILYDCVQTLAEHVGAMMASPELVNLLMPALIKRWQKVQDQSREMFPLLECLSYVAVALGPAFAPFAGPFFQRCINIIRQNLEEGESASTNPNFDQPDKDFLVTSLDLLSAIIQALDEEKNNELTANSNPNMFHLLAYCMRDSNNDVKQSAYALLGDCAIYVNSQLKQYLPSIMDILLAQLDLATATEEPETAFRVINNACWSVGEITMKEQEGMAPYVDQLMQKLGTILVSSEVPISLNENAAIALGRLGISAHEKIAPHLASFAPHFLRVIRGVDWTDEKFHAFKGFTNIVLDNPQALERCLLDLFAEMASANPTVFRLAAQGPASSPLENFQKVRSHRAIRLHPCLKRILTIF